MKLRNGVECSQNIVVMSKMLFGHVNQLFVNDDLNVVCNCLTCHLAVE